MGVGITSTMLKMSKGVAILNIQSDNCLAANDEDG
jgi:hypothetical protein